MAKKKAKKDTFDNKTMLLSPQSPFSVQEAYKTLRTNVVFSLPGADCKCIGVTSPTRGEGKSTIAINLAISLAQLDQKVILIDCDMRLPTLLKKLNISEKEGLSNYLSGTIDTLPIYRVKERGIDFIPSGTIPPDSTILIDSAVMKELIQVLKTKYDYVILDFPPVNIVSDAVLLVNQIDGYLMVVRHGYSEHQRLNEAFRQMRFAGAKIIGFVYNDKSNNNKYYKKGKGYRYDKYYYRYKKAE